MMPPCLYGLVFNCRVPAKAGHSISINEPVDSRVKGAVLYRFHHFDFGESGRSRRQAPGLSIQLSKRCSSSVSSNRTEQASGEGKAHAFSRCAAHAQAKKP